MNVKHICYGIILLLACGVSVARADAKTTISADHRKIIAKAKEFVWMGSVKANDKEFITTPPEGYDKTIAYIPDVGAKRVIDYGRLSGAALACGVPWEAHYKALMAYQREKMRRNPYQMGYIGVLHGAGMASTKDDACDATVNKSAIMKQLDANIAVFALK